MIKCTRPFLPAASCCPCLVTSLAESQGALTSALRSPPPTCQQIEACNTKPPVYQPSSLHTNRVFIIVKRFDCMSVDLEAHRCTFALTDLSPGPWYHRRLQVTQWLTQGRYALLERDLLVWLQRRRSCSRAAILSQSTRLRVVLAACGERSRASMETNVVRRCERT